MNKLYKKILNINYFPRILSIFIIVLMNWTFQSILYMNKIEKIFKLSIDLFLTVLLLILFYKILPFYSALFSSILIAHTINWLFNGQIFALFKTFGIIKTKPATFIKYINNLKDKGSKEDSILLIATFGSISREELKETSDIDIRIVRKKGFFNSIKSCIFIIKERKNAFFNKFPLDIYLLDNVNEFKNMKEDPILIYSDD